MKKKPEDVNYHGRDKTMVRRLFNRAGVRNRRRWQDREKHHCIGLELREWLSRSSNSIKGGKCQKGREKKKRGKRGN